jgi:flavin reductase (DIM6/NTAB) family NADH-FMN oxidoreductase RutF
MRISVAIDSDQFKKALQNWASGVTVVTAKSQSFGNQGMTVSAFSSVSAEPPQILVCVNRAVATGEGILESGMFAVNILSAKQTDTSNTFAGGISHEDRFAAVPWEEGENGAPLLSESIASLECKVVEKLSSGTHWIVIGEVQRAVLRDGEPLLYYKAGYRHLKMD